MKWIKRLFRRHLPEQHDRPSTAGTHGTEAVKQALDNLGEARAQWPEVRAVAGSLRQLRERNHFAEQLQHIFEGGNRP